MFVLVFAFSFLFFELAGVCVCAGIVVVVAQPLKFVYKHATNTNIDAILFSLFFLLAIIFLRLYFHMQALPAKSL